MRKIELQGKVYGTTQQIVDALAWATNRRGRVAWKDSKSVNQAIFEYLSAHNVLLPNMPGLHGSRQQIRNVIKRLVKEGYAEVDANGPQGAYLMFKFKDDVDLNGHIPEFAKVQAQTLPAGITYDDAGSEGRLTQRPVIDMDALLPPGPKPERYMFKNVNAALDGWAENDPDGYAKWAETLIERLGAIYG